MQAVHSELRSEKIASRSCGAQSISRDFLLDLLLNTNHQEEGRVQGVGFVVIALVSQGLADIEASCFPFLFAVVDGEKNADADHHHRCSSSVIRPVTAFQY